MTSENMGMQLGVVEQKLPRDQLSKETQIGFSQFGEDLAIWAALENRGRIDRGFYVDVGAFDPFRFSNTALLHLLKGWRGVNIDANAAAIEAFNRHRPDDINIHSAISDIEEDVTFYEFNHGAVDTIDPRMVEVYSRSEKSPFKVRKQVSTRTRRLDQILADVPNVPKDFALLSIDCEGLDHRVLTSLDWLNFKPAVIAIECHGFDLSNVHSHQTYSFLTGKGYKLISHIVVTSIYARV